MLVISDRGSDGIVLFLDQTRGRSSFSGGDRWMDRWGWRVLIVVGVTVCELVFYGVS